MAVRRVMGRCVRPLAALLVAASLAGCVPVLMGGALVGTTMVATDRRSPGMQLEDQAIEQRMRNAVNDNFGDKIQVTPSSYNRHLLLVGAASDEATRERLDRFGKGTQNVRTVTNRIEVGPGRTMSAAANDSWISGQVRAQLIGASKLPSNTFAITTWRGVVYLQARVSRAEGAAAARVASSVRGVKQVVTLYEYISDEEAARTVGQEPTAEPTHGTPAPTAGNTASSLAPAAPAPAAVEPSGGAQVIPIPRAP